MLGSGGAARAIAFALGKEAGIDRLTILGIDDQERVALARDLREDRDDRRRHRLLMRVRLQRFCRYSCADPLHTRWYVAKSTGDFCSCDVSPCGIDGHGLSSTTLGTPGC